MNNTYGKNGTKSIAWFKMDFDCASVYSHDTGKRGVDLLLLHKEGGFMCDVGRTGGNVHDVANFIADYMRTTMSKTRTDIFLRIIGKKTLAIHLFDEDVTRSLLALGGQMGLAEALDAATEGKRSKTFLPKKKYKIPSVKFRTIQPDDAWKIRTSATSQADELESKNAVVFHFGKSKSDDKTEEEQLMRRAERWANDMLESKGEEQCRYSFTTTGSGHLMGTLHPFPSPEEASYIIARMEQESMHMRFCYGRQFDKGKSDRIPHMNKSTATYQMGRRRIRIEKAMSSKKLQERKRSFASSRNKLNADTSYAEAVRGEKRWRHRPGRAQGEGQGTCNGQEEGR